MERARILLVDDEPLVSKLYSCALERLGHEAAFASDGEEGLAMASDESFDLILTDLQMPVRTGDAMIAALAQRGRKTCPVLLLTATNCGQELVSAVEAGSDDFIRKGQPFQEVIARVQFWLGGPFAGLPSDARAQFVERAPRVSAAITTLERLGRTRWQMLDRAALSLIDQIDETPAGFGARMQDRQRLLGVCAGILDRLGQSDPLSYLRRADLMVHLVSHVAPRLADRAEQHHNTASGPRQAHGLAGEIMDDLKHLNAWTSDPTYRHAQQTLRLSMQP